jgi:hypothetical protein
MYRPLLPDPPQPSASTYPDAFETVAILTSPRGVTFHRSAAWTGAWVAGVDALCGAGWQAASIATIAPVHTPLRMVQSVVDFVMLSNRPET